MLHHAYEWGQHTLRKIDKLGRDVLHMDSDKRAEIPSDKRTGIVKRLKDQQDEKESRRDKLLQKIKGFRKRKL